MKNILRLRTAMISVMFFATLNSLSQNIVTVTDCNLNGWIKQPIGNSSLGFIHGPSNPPIGKGSLKFYVPPGTNPNWPGDFVRFRNGRYSGTPLSSLTEISYETYVEARDTIADIPFIVILVDINEDGTAEHNLVFDPRYQNPKFIRSTMPDQGITRENVWQKWDCLHGGWFFGGTTDTDPDHDGPFFTLAEYMNLYPKATIRNDAAKGGPAIRLSAGGVVFKANFYGEIDDFKIGIKGITTTYDFEFTTADAGADKQVVYGYGSNCTTLNGSAAGGVAPYTYSWSPGGSSPSNSSTQVCPATSTAYTLRVTDANGCNRTDDVTVFVNDVRCGDKMSKVKVCHNGHAICIAPASVQAHLNHGDVLGSCDGEQATKARKHFSPEWSEQLHLFNYPNPFTTSTSIRYELPFDSKVCIIVYDAAGKQIAVIENSNKKAGSYYVDFNSGNLTTGIYYYQINATSANAVLLKTKKMAIVQRP